jgi:hypothetical protein
MPSLYIYVGALLYLLLAAWCMGAPKPISSAEE